MFPSSPLLNQEKVYRHVPKDQENSAENAQTQSIVPQSQDIETETRQDSGAGDFDVEAVLLVDEGKVADFVDDETFETVVVDGELWTSVKRIYWLG